MMARVERVEEQDEDTVMYVGEAETAAGNLGYYVSRRGWDDEGGVILYVAEEPEGRFFTERARWYRVRFEEEAGPELPAVHFEEPAEAWLHLGNATRELQNEAGEIGTRCEQWSNCQARPEDRERWGRAVDLAGSIREKAARILALLHYTGERF